MRKIICTILVLLFIVASLTGCQHKPEKHIVVGSKDFTESYILAELYALALEKEGFSVERKLNLGGTNVVQAGIQKGDLDLYPEYTGTCLLNVLHEPMMTDSQKVYDKVSKAFKEKYKLLLLQPAKASNSEALAISKKMSEQYGITNISELQKNAQFIRFASQGAFEKNADGMPALVSTYGEFKFKSVEYFDNAIKYELIKNDKADLVLAFSTDGQLIDPAFVLLDDDKHAWPPYDIVPIVREDILAKYPAIEGALNAVSAKLDNQTMQALNAEVDIKKREPAAVAKEFFNSSGLNK